MADFRETATSDELPEGSRRFDSAPHGRGTHMRVHLDPVGGIAGDMFIAACADLWPELIDKLSSLMNALDVPDDLSIEILAHNDGVLTGRRFVVRESRHGHHGHVRFTELRTLIERSRLPKSVQRRAIDIFARLASAEARVHGTSVDAVVFHEVGEWDSVIDVCGAALAIEEAGPVRWTIGSLPLGGGQVKSAHGLLPVPAPATMMLLQGMVTHTDGIAGERVTPTGAAILSHLQPEYLITAPPSRLLHCGNAFGLRRLDGISNVLRILAYEDIGFSEPFGIVGRLETIMALNFEIDDQTPEDLALALDAVRAMDGVFDIIQIPAFGKKGRLAIQVQILTRSDRASDVANKCFSETTTLGVRLQEIRRVVLDRSVKMVTDDTAATRVKVVTRPGGRSSAKAEIADLAQTVGGHAQRQARRARVEGALQGKTKVKRNPR